MKRRKFLKYMTLLGVGVGAGSIINSRPLFSKTALTGKINLSSGWKDFSPSTGKERKAIPSACQQCFVRDGIIGYVEDGRVVKIEGNPDLPRTNGKLCSKGQAGAAMPYNPDRLLYPMVRVGKRGEGKWKRISWEEAYSLIIEGGVIAGRRVKGMRELRDAGEAEKLMYHYGRQDGSEAEILKKFFLKAYGTKTIVINKSICVVPKWAAQESIWGRRFENPDVQHARYVMNFSSNLLECYHNHIPCAQRLVEGRANGGKMVTFDVRLTNTAAKSDEWLPIRPGTDAAVVLAMCNQLVHQFGIYDEEFINTYTNTSIEEIKEHVKDYTPEWAEEISGVPAEKIKKVAYEYATIKPSVCLDYRGAVMHYNGLQVDRAVMLLEALAGNIDVPGGRCKCNYAKWKHSYQHPKNHAKKLNVLDGEGFAFPTHHVSHQVYKMVRDGKHGRPEIYLVALTNPVYAFGDCRETSEIFKNEELFPFIINANIGIDETAELSDLLLPDATYLERWSTETGYSGSNMDEYYIRQPMHPPLGEARNLIDVCLEIGRRLDLGIAFKTAEEFVKNCCDNTPGVREAGGFEFMKKHGAWYDKEKGPGYLRHTQKIKTDIAGGRLDEKTGVYYIHKPGEPEYSEMNPKLAHKRYVGQRCNDGVIRRGFPPDLRFKKSGLFEIKSAAWDSKGFGALPIWIPIPEHQNMGSEQLILTTYKHANMNHSRGNWCWPLVELYHENPAWLNTMTAQSLGIQDGDHIQVSSEIDTITTKARVTEGIVPGVIAISAHCGHWKHSYWATGEKDPATHRPDDVNIKHRWWSEKGAHPNPLIPNKGEPASGGLRWMDTVVSVKKVTSREI